MLVFCEEKKRTDEEAIYNVIISSTAVGTLSHKIGTNTWTVRNILNSQWRTGDLIECCRDLFFPESKDEITFVDQKGKTIQFPGK